MADWRSDIGEAVGAEPGAVRFDEPLSEHTTFRIGGPADAWIEVPDQDTLTRAFKFCAERGVRWWILGRGSNVLVSDQGLGGVVLHLAGRFTDIEVKAGMVEAGGAALLDYIAEQAERAGLRGAGFLAGIPGTVGGGLATNAGAFGRRLSDVLEQVTVMDRSGRVTELGADRFSRGYRSPVVEPGLVVLRVVLRLVSGMTESASDVRRKRRVRQPEEPSAGSFFKNPIAENLKAQVPSPKAGVMRGASGAELPRRIPAGRLIEQCGLKGRMIGGAQVSEKHANFIINTGSARFSDVYELAQVVKAGVEEKNGIVLEEEVQVLPETQEVS